MLLPLAYCFPEHVAPPGHTASCVVCAACPHSIMVDCIVFGPEEEEGNKNPEPFLKASKLQRAALRHTAPPPPRAM
jgi:hypothetical protein